MIKIIDTRNMSAAELRNTVSALTKRESGAANVTETVAGIIADVRKRGDAALLEYTKRFDRAELSSVTVSDEEKEAAVKAVDPELYAVMREAAANIELFHRNQLRSGFMVTDPNRPGVILGQRVMPIERVGVYVPGGSAPLPSSVLMNIIPAKLAGVGTIAMATPPSPDGSVNPVIIAAAQLAGADVIYKMGGAQAVAALAYGTESVERVYKIVGPGNVFVAEAKRQVFGQVGIDMIAGPSEVVVLADSKSDPVVVAADMLSQAEHDRLAASVLITDSEGLAAATALELDAQIKLLSRSEIASASIDNYGAIVITDSLIGAAEAVNEIAPEHLEVMCDDPFSVMPLIRNAGSVFLGRNCPEPLGDYYAGTNHVLPTSGSAKFSSPLSVDDFVKKSSYMYYTEEALSAAAARVERFALAEGLTAHARSAVIRFEK